MPKLAACGSDSGHIFYNANFQNLRVTTIPANASENKTGTRLLPLLGEYIVVYKVYKNIKQFLYISYNAKTVYALILQIVYFFTTEKMM